MIQPPSVGPMAGASDDRHAVDGEGHAALFGGKVSARIACSLGCRPPPPSALQDAEEDEHAEIGREPAQERAGGEERDAGHVEALAADQRR